MRSRLVELIQMSEESCTETSGSNTAAGLVVFVERNVRQGAALSHTSSSTLVCVCAMCGLAAGADCPTGSRWCVRGGPKVLATSYTILRAPNRACTVLLRRLLRPRAPCRCRSWPSCRAAVRASARILPFVLLVGAAPHLTRPSRLALIFAWIARVVHPRVLRYAPHRVALRGGCRS